MTSSTRRDEPAGLWNVPVPRMSDAPGGGDKGNASAAGAAAATTSSSSEPSQQETHQQGIEHIKRETQQPSHLESSAATSGSGAPPASNPSSDDPSGGIPAKEGAGGVAAAAGAVGVGTAVAAHEERKHGNPQSSHLESSKAANAEPSTSSSTSQLIGQPPASNPSSDDPSGGIAKGHGGVSGAAYVDSPVGDVSNKGSSDNNENSTILGTVASYLGLGKSGEAVTGGEAVDDHASAAAAAADGTQTSSFGIKDDPNDNQSSTASGAAYGYVAAAGAAVASTAAAVQERVTGTKQDGATSEASDGTYLDYSASHPDSDPAKDSVSQAQAPDQGSQAPRSELVDRTVEKVKETVGPSDSAKQTSSSSSTAKGGPSDKDHNSSGYNKNKMSDDAGEKKPNPATRENKDAIPTAGGERLGEKHWGESKVVPDNPKAEDSGTGVASTDGQPNDETKANTAKNAGGADTGTHESEGGKENVMDKIKDKLHIGKKE